MDFGLTGEIDEMLNPETVIGFLYEMCFEQPFGEELIHPKVEKFLSELNKYILYDSMDSNSFIKINPAFFRENIELSERIIPVLAQNIREYSERDIKIQCGNYTLLLTGDSMTEYGMVAHETPESPKHIKTYGSASKSADGFLKLLNNPSLSRFSTKSGS